MSRALQLIETNGSTAFAIGKHEAIGLRTFRQQSCTRGDKMEAFHMLKT